MSRQLLWMVVGVSALAAVAAAPPLPPESSNRQLGELKRISKILDLVQAGLRDLMGIYSMLL
ncbi:hypothetical protein SK128_019225 [Halocaridina rubra]|uniref:Uncharacterized protein n=1 Tax=Halocaridina rubra TaxID=373956 RepID=A0AAN9A636_HALRR